MTFQDEGVVIRFQICIFDILNTAIPVVTASTTVL